MIRRFRRIIGMSLVAMCTIALALVVGGAGRSDAARLVTHGWWWRAQTGALVGVPPPPHVPEGGLAVGNNADGATAISAVRFELAANESNPILTLKVAQSFAGPDVKMAACHTGSAWFGVQAGSWADAPNAACGLGSVAGVRSEDGAVWTFPLGSLQVGKLVDVVIVPPNDASAPFEVSFERPTAASLQTTVGTGGSGGPTGPPPPPPEFFVPPGFEDFGGFDDGFGPPAGPTQPFEPALPPDAQLPEEDASVSQSQQQAFGTSSAGLLTEDDGDPRPLALLILVVGLAAGAMMIREPLPAPRLLGPAAAHGGARAGQAVAAETQVRGLGRFSRDRHGPAPKLF